MSSLSAFIDQQKRRWYRRGIDHSHQLRRFLAYYVALHGFEIGDYSMGRPNIRFYRNSRLKIGSYCSIAEGSTFIVGGQHDSAAVTTFLLGKIEPAQRDIVIGSDVWIAANALIASGVTIGDGAVIGAGAVVIGDVPPYAIAFGSPARVVRKRFSDEIIDQLLELKWWDFDRELVLKLKPLLVGTDMELFLKEARKLKGLPPRPENGVSAARPVEVNERREPRPGIEARIRDRCISFMAKELNLSAGKIDPHVNFARLGMDSTTSILLLVELEDWLGLKLDPEIIFSQPSIVELSRYLAGRCVHDLDPVPG